MSTETAVMEATTEIPMADPWAQTHKQPENSSRLLLPWLLPGMVSSAWLWAAFFPLSWGPVAWFALVPLLTLTRLKVSRSRIFLGAFLSGSLFFWAVLQWMRVADFRMNFTYAGLSTACALFFPIGIALIRLLDGRLPMVVSVPLVWTALEFIRSWIFTGFAWYFLGHTQHANLPMIQISDLTGAYGVSFLIAAVNGWLLDCLWQIAPLRRWLGVTEASTSSGPKMLLVQAVCVAGLITGTYCYGDWQLGRAEFEQGPKLALLQGNFDQRIQIQQPTNAAMMKGYGELCNRARFPQAPDLMVWPETSYPDGFIELPRNMSRVPDRIRGFYRDQQDTFEYLARQTGSSQLLGVNCRVYDEQGNFKNYNSAVLIPRDQPDKPQRFDKIHRVPFGEYVPLRDWFPFMNSLAPYDYDYGVQIGEKMTRFQLGKYRFGVVICNEDTDPTLARGYGITDKDGPPVDFILNICNESWFDDTCEHEQHLAICRFRAIEARRAVARSVNSGISAIIDSNGRVQKPQHEVPLGHYEYWEIKPVDGAVPDLPESEWASYKKTEGILRGNIPIDHRESLYVQWGDWFPWGCCIVIGAGLSWGWMPTSRWRKQAG